MAVEVNEDNFGRAVLQSEKIRLAQFHIPGCARCMVLMSAAEGFNVIKATTFKQALRLI